MKMTMSQQFLSTYMYMNDQTINTSPHINKPNIYKTLFYIALTCNSSQNAYAHL